MIGPLPGSTAGLAMNKINIAEVVSAISIATSVAQPECSWSSIAVKIVGAVSADFRCHSRFSLRIILQTRRWLQDNKEATCGGADCDELRQVEVLEGQGKTIAMTCKKAGATEQT